jgi:hypothetical protein
VLPACLQVSFNPLAGGEGGRPLASGERVKLNEGPNAGRQVDAAILQTTPGMTNSKIV